MNMKGLGIAMGVGVVAGAVAIMMTPRSSSARKLANKAADKVEDMAAMAANKVEDMATMVADKIEDTLDM